MPVPAISGEPTEDTVYSNALLSGLFPNTTYHYSVSNDGVNWSPDVTFTTAAPGPSDFRFTMVGDEATSDESSLPIAQVIAGLRPKFNVVVGDLSYAGDGSGYYTNGVPTGVTDFSPANWDAYLGIVGPAAAQSIPWQVGVGNHEMEPLDNFGYVGFTTRFPQAYAPRRSPAPRWPRRSPMATWPSSSLTATTCRRSCPTTTATPRASRPAWLAEQLAEYRAPWSGIDFIIVGFHNWCISTNTTHGSDGGIRMVWQSLFDRYQVDLVVSGHVHAYERSYPIRGGDVTKVVPSGGKVHPAADGTTYIGAGGGGQGLYTGWYGATGGGDPANASGPPLVWEWTGIDTAGGGTGTAEDIPDPVTDYSAYRHANWSFIVLDVAAPRFLGGETSVRSGPSTPLRTAAGSPASPAPP